MSNEEGEAASHLAGSMNKKKRSRRRRKPRSAKNNQVQPVEKQQQQHHGGASKKHHDAPMTKRDLYFSLHCELVSIGHGAPAVARVTMINWDAEVVLDTFVQVPVPVTDFRLTGITPDVVSTHNPQAMSFAKVRQSVHQILKGKILVGYNLQEHLTALGLTHPPTDVRDAAKFQMFQYEEIDGVCKERVVVERPLVDLAAEFLHREVSVAGNPMDACIVALDLYKTHRKEWETRLVELTHQGDQNRNYYAVNAVSVPRAYASHSRSFEEARPRLPSYDESLPGYGGVSVAPQPEERSSSWFSLGRSRQSYNAQESNRTQPVLTPEALESLNCSQYGEMPAYARHHPYYGHGGAMVYASSSSNPGSSTYYEDSSMISDSYATESVASSSVHDEGQHGFPQPPAQQTMAPSSSTISSSWFRFGSRRTRYPEQLPKEPMSSLTEEPDDSPNWPVQSSIVPVELIENISPETDEQGKDEIGIPNNTDDEKPSSSSWFSFRRPKSPRPGKSQEDSGDERASTPNRRRRSNLNTGRSGKWQEESSDDRATTPSRRRRASLGSTNLSDSIRSGGRQSSVGSAGRRNSLDQEQPALTESEEPEKQSSSWFSFRRSSRSTSVPKGRTMFGTNAKEDPSESNDQPDLLTKGTETLEEDWMREVVGSPNSQEKELLTVSWDSESVGLEAQEIMVPEASRQLSAKESKWLPRFLRSSKSTAGDSSATRDDYMQETSRYEWPSQPPVAPLSMNDQQPKILNPSFFSRNGGGVGTGGSPGSSDVDDGEYDGVFFPRSRLETECTLPTVASEGEDEVSGDSFDDSGQEFVHGTEENFAYLNL